MKIRQLKTLQTGQRGFTLLELLVVVTLLAVLATGALVAYDGAGDKAQSARAANTIGTLDQGVRAYKAVTQKYPNQWDNLANPVDANTAAGSSDFIPARLQQVLGSLDLAAAASGLGISDLEKYFADNFGMDEIQHIFGTGVGINGVVEPNRAHNEGTNPPLNGNGAIETEFDDFGETNGPTYISILASRAYQRGSTTEYLDCTAGGESLTTTFLNDAGTGNGSADPRRLNAINDALSTERCNLVLALGFGGDAAQSTVNSTAGVVQAPTYSSKTVNPAVNYGRYVGLFLLATGEKGTGGAGVADLGPGQLLPRPRLLGFIDTEANTIDANIASATRD